MAKKNPKVACYYRVSTKGQKDRGTIENQVDKAKEHCPKEGYKVVAEFSDPAVSGNSPIDSRPEGSKLMSLLRKQEIDGVVTVHMDRLTRSDSLAERGMILEEFRVAGAFLDQIDATKLDFSEESHELIAGIEQWAAAKYRRDMVKKQQAGRDRALRENRFAAGGQPYGVRWDKEQGKWVMVEEQYEALKYAAKVLQTGIGADTVAKLLNENGHRTKRNKKWSPGSVWNMFQNNFYFTGKRSDGLDTGLKLFKRSEIMDIRKRMKHRKRTRKRRRKVQNNFLLKGILSCRNCGWNMSIQDLGKYRYYWCKRCGNRNRAAVIEAEVLEMLIGMPENLANAIKEMNMAKEVDPALLGSERIRLEGQLEKIQKARNNASKNLAREYMNEEAFIEFKQELDDEEKEAKRQLEVIENTLERNTLKTDLENAKEVAAKAMKETIKSAVSYRNAFFHGGADKADFKGKCNEMAKTFTAMPDKTIFETLSKPIRDTLMAMKEVSYDRDKGLKILGNTSFTKQGSVQASIG